jgi:hypothetical protein
VADLPDRLVKSRHLELRDARWRTIARWSLIGALTLLLLLALANAFGQRPNTSEVSSGVGKLKVYAPTKLRSGLFYEARFTIEARREIAKATLVLDPGWLEGMTLNTLEPAPIGEASRDGSIALELGHIRPGTRHIFFLQFQVNPTNLGRRSQRVERHDDTTPLLAVDRNVTVWP